MASSAILITILTHPFQVLLAAAVLVHAVRATLSGLSESGKAHPANRATVLPAQRHAA
jgi:hypothetical protein